MRSRKPGWRGERGATLVMVALCVFMLFGMAALSIDYGMVKATKAEAQRAVDAAALAGASAFIEPDPMNDDSAMAVARADSFAAMHTVRQVLIDTTTEINVEVILAEEKVRVTFTRTGMPVWFANVFGVNSVGITAVAAAHVIETSKAACVMPVAIPDLWKNIDLAPGGGNDQPEELVVDGLWDYVDANANGVMDSRERELWEFDPGADLYDQALYGYGSDFRDTMGVGNDFLNKTNDYGRQITLMTLAPQDGTTSSNYYAWGLSPNDANSGDVLRDKISSPSCEIVTIGGDGYDASAGNGATAGAVSPAWDTRIGYDPAARWNDGTNTVDYSDAGDAWLTDSPRTVIVALYDPQAELLTPNDNNIVFNNFAKIWVDQRPPGCFGAGCKAPITGRFLGFVGGPGGGGVTTGTLIKSLELIE